MNIAGIQRLTLDQAYYLSDSGLSPVIFVRMPENKNKVTFKSIEHLLISEKVEVIYLCKSFFKNLKILYQFFKESRLEILISHSLKGTATFRLFRILLIQKYKIVTTLHNYISLAGRLNQIKIIVYSQLSDELLSYSKSVIKDWEEVVKTFFIFRHLRRKLLFCRNGVYLPRLNPVQQSKYSDPRIIFIGRLVDWKGFRELPKIIKYDIFLHHSLIILTQDKTLPNSELFSNPYSLINSKSIATFEFFSTDIHIYPVSYNSRVGLKENIGMNVLEMAAIGVTTLISTGGDISWPELSTLGIVKAVDFDNITEVTNAVRNIEFFSKSEISTIREIIDIKNNLRSIFSLVNLVI